MEYGYVFVWIAVCATLAALASPLTAALFPRFPGKGAGFALPVALGTLGVTAYWTGRIGFGLETAIVGVLVLGVGSGVALYRGVAVDRRAYAETMGVFLAAFLLLVSVRALDPAVHPGGGEKFLDFGLLNTLWRSQRLPPEDMWFAGKRVEYYYGGHMIAVLLAKLTFTPPRYAYNLALPGFYAVLVTGVYTLAGAVATEYDANRRSAGVLAALLVGLASNLLTPIRFVAWVASLASVDSTPVLSAVGVSAEGLVDGPRHFGYWAASRVIEGTVTEFPFFGFLNGDLHAHMMSTGFTVLVAGVCYSYWQTPERAVWRRRGVVFVVVPLLAGLLAVVNTWSFPTVLGLAWLTVALAPARPWTLFPLPDRTEDPEAVADGGGPPDDADRTPEWETEGTPANRQRDRSVDPAKRPRSTGTSDRAAEPDADPDPDIDVNLPVDPGAELGRVVSAGLVAAVVGVVGALVVYPFFATTASDRGLALVTETSGFWELLVTHGGFLAITIPYLAVHADPGPGRTVDRLSILGVLAILAVLAYGFPLAPVAVAVFGPLLLTAWALLRVGDDVGYETVLLVGALGLILLVEVAYVTGADRFNTVFKFYEQVWVLWGTGAAVMLARHADPVDALFAAVRGGVDAVTGDGDGRSLAAFATGTLRPDRGLVRSGLAGLVVVSTLLYPGLALAEHVETSSGEATLDATAFVERQHATEHEAIEWVGDRDGQPTIVTAPTKHLYRWTTDRQLRSGSGDRVVGASAPASLTGVPTVVGWYVETYYRGDEPVLERVRDVGTIYDDSVPPERRVRLLKRYDVEYVYVGPAERDRYGTTSFDDVSGVEVGYRDEWVTIYRVDQDELGVADSAESNANS